MMDRINVLHCLEVFFFSLYFGFFFTSFLIGPGFFRVWDDREHDTLHFTNLTLYPLHWFGH